LADQPIGISLGPNGSDPLTEKPDAQWFVRAPGGGQFGPASNDLLRTWIADGRVGLQSSVWRSGWADWLPAGRVFSNLVDAPPQVGWPGASKSATASYLEKKSQRFRFRPVHYLAIALGLIALIGICIIIF
jgi:hypothetical protein